MLARAFAWQEQRGPHRPTLLLPMQSSSGAGSGMTLGSGPGLSARDSPTQWGGGHGVTFLVSPGAVSRAGRRWGRLT
jgi:hypothetical protein